MNIRFHGRGFDTPSDQSTLTYEWDFGDGKTASGLLNDEIPGWSSEDNVEHHRYTTTKSQTYSATFTVMDNHEEVTVWTILVSVTVDSDGDQVQDGVEFNLGMNPFNFDTDGDWLIDLYEIEPPTEIPTQPWPRETSPRAADTDGDGCSDWEEIWPGLDDMIMNPNDPDMDDDGLLDCKEVYSEVFKTEDRFMLIPLASEVSFELPGVGTYSPFILTAEAKIGITGLKPSELELVIENADGDSFIIKNEGEGDDSNNLLFASYNMISAGFNKVDFKASQSWTLLVGKPSLSIGYLEFFEIHIISRTDPQNDDSDSDSLSDYEEVNLAEYGWLTNPWISDTDGDGVSDSREVKVLGTDPTRQDTDRDGTNDADDSDPLNNLAIRLDLNTITALGWDKPKDMFFEVRFSDTETWDTTRFFTEHLNMPDKKDEIWHYNRQYTFDIPDSKSSVGIQLLLWEQSSDDAYLWDINPNEGAESIMFTHYTYEDKSSFSSSGDEDGEPDKHDAEVTFDVVTISATRITTCFLNSTDSESLYVTPDNNLRYVGEQEFYIVILDLNQLQNQMPFVGKYNAIIVPRTVFVNSQLNYLMQNAEVDDDGHPIGLPEYVENLEFSELGDSSLATVGSVVGTITGSMREADAMNLLEMLREDSLGNDIAEANWFHFSQLFTLNLDDDVLEYIPMKQLRFDAIGESPDFDDGFWADAWGAIVEVVEWVAGVVTSVVDVILAIGEFIVEVGMWIIGTIFDFISDIMDAISFITDIILKVVEATVDWVYENIVSRMISAIAPIVLITLRVIGGPILEQLGQALFDSLDYLLIWFVKDFVPGVADIIRGALGVAGSLVKIVEAFVDCAFENFDVIVGGAAAGCGEILDALRDLKQNIEDIFLAAWEIGSGFVVTLFTVLLRMCGTYRGLNDDEMAVARSVFGSSIELEKVRIYLGYNPSSLLVLPQFCAIPLMEIIHAANGGRAMTTMYLINMDPDDIGDNSLLIHELVHVWQVEEEGPAYLDALEDQIREGNDPGCGEGDAYYYGQNSPGGCNNGNGAEDSLMENLTAAGGNGHQAFSDYEGEEQAEMIEHYYVRRFERNLDYAAWQPYADAVCEGSACRNTAFVEWVGSGDYENDGLNPETGTVSSTLFEFRVVYRNESDEAPRIHNLRIRNGGTDIAGSPFAMNFLEFAEPGGDYTSGAVYTFETTLGDVGDDYEYRFEFSDGVMSWSTGMPAIWTVGPTVNA
jgi:hypothetical protein